MQSRRNIMQISPYLTFPGQCEVAFKFYEKSLGGKIVMMMPFSEMPGQDSHVPTGWADKIVHARMIVQDQILMASDAPPERYERPQGFSVSLQIKEPDEAERVFHALAENGQISMPIQPTFWSLRFGMLVDQFGIPWMINCEQENPQA
jgi:PhnB protein